MLRAGDKIAIIILNADMLHRVTKKFLRRCYTIWEGRLLKKKQHRDQCRVSIKMQELNLCFSLASR